MLCILANYSIHTPHKRRYIIGKRHLSFKSRCITETIDYELPPQRIYGVEPLMAQVAQ